MFAIFNRFDARLEEAARDLGATPWQTFRHVVLPIILPSLVGVALFGFTLSWDEIARSSQAIGLDNTLPLELQALTTTVTTPADLCARHRDDRRLVRRHRRRAARHHVVPRPPGSPRLRRRPGVRPTTFGKALVLWRWPQRRDLLLGLANSTSTPVNSLCRRLAGIDSR